MMTSQSVPFSTDHGRKVPTFILVQVKIGVQEFTEGYVFFITSPARIAARIDNIIKASSFKSRGGLVQDV
jgi:hypothetical protein